MYKSGTSSKAARFGTKVVLVQQKAGVVMQDLQTTRSCTGELESPKSWYRPVRVPVLRYRLLLNITFSCYYRDPGSGSTAAQLLLRGTNSQYCELASGTSEPPSGPSRASPLPPGLSSRTSGSPGVSQPAPFLLFWRGEHHDYNDYILIGSPASDTTTYHCVCSGFSPGGQGPSRRRLSD